MSEHDQLAEALRSQGPYVDAAAVATALADVHARSHRHRRHQRRVRGGLGAAAVVLLIAGVATVATLGGSDETVIGDQPGGTDGMIFPSTTATAPTTTATETTEPPPVAAIDDLAIGVTGLELSTFHVGDDWRGLWRADDDLAQRVADDLLGPPPEEPPDDEILDRATMRFELVDGSVVFVPLDLESGWVEGGLQLDQELTHELRTGLDDAVSSPWRVVDLDGDDDHPTLTEVLATIRDDAGPLPDTPEAALVEVLDAFEATGGDEPDRWLGEVVDSTDERTTIIVRHRGLGDDSGRGHDFRITLRWTDQGYELDRAEARWLCVRGVPSGPDYFCV